MHVRDLVDLAAFVAVHSPAFIRGAGRVLPSAIEEYWTASRCRLDRWTRLLRQLADAESQFPQPATLAWPRVRPVLEEILSSELLTRLWTAAAVAYDRARDEEELAPPFRSIFAGHLEARRRLLTILAEGRAIDLVDVAKLDQLRRRVERWTDLMLAHTARDVDVTEFAFEPERAVHFAEDLDHEAVAAERQFTCQLMTSSLRAAFQMSPAERSPNADLNRRIAAAILTCVGQQPSEAGGLKSLWVERMSAVADGAQELIDQLVACDARAIPRSPTRD
jgi:hypothetical protein